MLYRSSYTVPVRVIPFWKSISYYFVFFKLRNDKEEYKTAMTTIDKIVQDHHSKMKRGTPQLNMCDSAVMVSLYLNYMKRISKHFDSLSEGTSSATNCVTRLSIACHGKFVSELRDAGTGGGGGRQEGQLSLLPFARRGKGGRSAL